MPVFIPMQKAGGSGPALAHGFSRRAAARRRPPLRAGLHWLGDDSAAAFQLSQGIDPSTGQPIVVDPNTGAPVTISPTGATIDANGTTTGSAAAITAAANAAATLAPAGTGVPAGTQLQYNVTWSGTLTNVYSPSTIASQVAANLAANWNIQVLSETDNSSIASMITTSAGSGFTLIVQLVGAYGQLSDVKAVIDGAVTAAGRTIVSSSLGPVSSTGIMAFLQANAVWIGGGLLAIFLLPDLIEAIRG